MKVVLNQPVLDLGGKPVIGFNRNPVTFASKVISGLVNGFASTPEEVEKKFKLAEKIQETLESENPTVLDLSEEEYEYAGKLISRENVLIRARFAEMLAENNP